MLLRSKICPRLVQVWNLLQYDILDWDWHMHMHIYSALIVPSIQHLAHWSESSANYTISSSVLDGFHALPCMSISARS